ncbi:hypothetical protein I311_00503 [Cryptococcus gattii NT-10]|nr:hypothetical protein I311_00503 [Cryptococcus gattii NT-10]
MVHLSTLFLLPLAFAAPAKKAARDIPELSVAQWASIQESLGDKIGDFAAWSWNKAENIVEDFGGPKDAGDDKTELTIWQRLKEDPHSFSRLTKIIEFEGKAIEYLDDKDLQITFFAPNNDALKPPHHHHHHHHHHHDDDDDALDALEQAPSLAAISDIIEREPALVSGDDDNDDDDEEKKRKKEILRKIIGKVLAYHGLPKAYSVQQLSQNSTVETTLKAEDGSYAGLHRRVRIEKCLVPPSIKLNFYAKIVAADRKCGNGYLHALDHPLIPPASILDELFLFPDSFSTLTSSVQKIHMAHALDFCIEHDEDYKHKVHGTPLATLFAPTNTAFALLPPRLKFFLFSRFGKKALTKLLAYHYVPHTLLLSEALHVEKHGHKDEVIEQFTLADGDDPSFHKEFKIETGLPNATLTIEIDKTKLFPVEGAVKTRIKVNGQTVQIIDVPSRNGAFHVISKLLIPPHKHHHHHRHDDKELSGDNSWENWEQWLPQWANEA